MRLYFSGATTPLAQQKDRTKSIGGNMSSTPIPNGRLGAIFPSISLYSQANESIETFAFFLYNDTNIEITNITIQQVLDEKFGKPVNQAKYEWAAVIPNENLQMELLESSRDEPFYANFFNPTSRREDCILKITQAPSMGAVVTLLGESIPTSIHTIEAMIDDIVGYFSSNANYKVVKYSPTEIYIKNLELINTQASIELRDGMILLSEPNSFSGYVNEETQIASTLQPKSAIGIWVKRKVLPQVKVACADLQEYDEDEVEFLEVLISHD